MVEMVEDNNLYIGKNKDFNMVDMNKIKKEGVQVLYRFLAENGFEILPEKIEEESMKMFKNGLYSDAILIKRLLGEEGFAEFQTKTGFPDPINFDRDEDETVA